MPRTLDPFQFLLVAVAGWMNRRQQQVIEYLRIRPIMGVFFATRRLSHLTPHEFVGTAFWLGFTLQTRIAEIWINRGFLSKRLHATLKSWLPNEATLRRSSVISKSTGAISRSSRREG